MAKAFPRGAGEDEEGEEEPRGSSESPGLGARSGVKMEAGLCAMGAVLGGAVGEPSCSSVGQKRLFGALPCGRDAAPSALPLICQG